ncbi:uncharacterized protein [Palaemon carinicauda]|uniref:uncharacterized protein n=1 Tax=Palaemon carinicauda TaxID=392227 RepID=UPI0035B5A941
MQPKYESPRKTLWKGILRIPSPSKGIFGSQSGPPSRLYCILSTFFFGILLITLGAVFYSIVLIQPLGAQYPVYVPPLPVACTLLASGIFVVILSIAAVLKHGFDDGALSLEGDLYNFTKDDVLDQNHQCPPKNPVV